MARFCVSPKSRCTVKLKLPGMASDFYKTQVARHLMIGIRAMELLSQMPLERITAGNSGPSRKRRSSDPLGETGRPTQILGSNLCFSCLACAENRAKQGLHGHFAAAKKSLCGATKMPLDVAKGAHHIGQ